MNVVEFKSVSKYYKNKKEKVVGIEDISFKIKKGDIVGLIGPNGAGKSTIVKIICGILKIDAGEVLVIDKEPWKNRSKLARRFGVMFGNRSSLWYNIPAIESVYLMKDIYNIDKETFEFRLKKYSDILELDDILNKPVRKLSLGQRIRIEILVTIIHHPELIILDEPTLGLDVVAKNNFRNILLNLAKISNTTIILTTHDLADVERICGQIILINNGKKILDIKNTEFLNWINDYTVIYIDKNKNLKDLSKSKFLREETPIQYKLIMSSDNTKGFIENLLRAYSSDIKFKLEKPSLEDMVYEHYK